MIPQDDVHRVMNSDLARRLDAGLFDPDEPDDLDDLDEFDLADEGEEDEGEGDGEPLGNRPRFR